MWLLQKNIAACQFLKYVFIFEKQIEQKKEMEDKVANLTSNTALPMIFLLNVILFLVRIKFRFLKKI